MEEGHGHGPASGRPETWYAHSLKDRPKAEWEPLPDHQRAVAAAAAALAERAFAAAAWGIAAGWLHDFGKASPAFQRRLEGAHTPVDHMTAGAREAIARYGAAGRLLAYAIAGHHGGMPDAGELDRRLADKSVPAPDPAAAEGIPDRLDLPTRVTDLPAFVRMVFSCLTDADFVETERFYGTTARGIPFAPDVLLAKLNAHLASLPADQPLSGLRRTILERCRTEASKRRGFFSLTVPTGGGKTLSSLAFALEHAHTHAHAREPPVSRVVYVIPYTSIIEQNAAVFRDALGETAVLEHHSNFRHPAEADDDDDLAKLKRAEENWDAPVVVTTSVQFFESLYTNRPARARKLHNLAGAVIILDEAQLLPAQLLAPCLAALKTLVRDYSATVVLCTATQPALTEEKWLPRHALTDVLEIMERPERLHVELARVEVSHAGTLTDAEVAERMGQTAQALAVVNTRDHARALFQAIAHLPGAFHLSARQCPAHRKTLLDEIRRRLEDGEPCRVVSTQLIEAGVDVDFQLVLRALAGLDNLVQTAGRCNRNRRRETGQVVLFKPAEVPAGLWANGAGLTERALKRFDDPLSPEAVRWYFRNLYQNTDPDEKRILELLKGPADFLFRKTAERFRLIEADGVDVVVEWDDAATAALAALDPKRPWRGLRGLQPYVIRIPQREAAALKLREVTERVHVIERSRYDDVLGLQPAGTGEEAW